MSTICGPATRSLPPTCQRIYFPRDIRMYVRMNVYWPGRIYRCHLLIDSWESERDMMESNLMERIAQLTQVIHHKYAQTIPSTPPAHLWLSSLEVINLLKVDSPFSITGRQNLNKLYSQSWEMLTKMHTGKLKNVKGHENRFK